MSKIVSTVTDRPNTSNFNKVFECYATCKDSDEEKDDEDIEEPVTAVSDIISTNETENSNITTADDVLLTVLHLPTP